MGQENLRKLKRKTIKLEEQLIEVRKTLTEALGRLEEQENKFFELEEVTSSYIYPLDRKIEDVQNQLIHLEKHFPALHLGNVIPSALPEYAEGWIVVPKFSNIASDYNDALETTLEILAEERPNFLNGREGELGKEYLRLNDRTVRGIEMLDETTKGDYLLFPVQLGSRHLGRSPRRARVLFKPHEFSLGPFEITVFLLTHPKAYYRR